MTLTADKYRARQYIRTKVGWEADNYLVPLLYVTDNPMTIPLNRLPDEYIIKPNHGAGWWIIKDMESAIVDSKKDWYPIMTKEDVC